MKAEPKFSKPRLKKFLKDQYCMKIDGFKFVPVGENSFAYVVKSGKDKKFLKMFSQTRVQKRVADKLDKTLKVVMQFHNLGINNISYPLLNKKGKPKSKFGKFTVVLFNYHNGKCEDETTLTRKQQIDLGKTLSMIHQSRDKIKLDKYIFDEPKIRYEGDINKCIGFAEKNTFTGYKEKLREMLQNNKKNILKILDEVKKLEKQIENVPEVICHKDPIGLNLIIDGEKVYLIDWDGLDLAPKEQDLWFYILESNFEIFNEYKRNVGKYQINKKVVNYCFFHRILEDFIDWIYQVFFEDVDEKETKRTYEGLIDWPTPFIKNYKKEWAKLSKRVDKINKRLQ